MATMPHPIPTRSPSLVVTSTSGLCNRIRMLLSGIAVAERTGRHFSMPWMRTKNCAAAYCELFANDWPVYDARAEEIVQLPWMDAARIREVLLADTRSMPDLRISWTVLTTSRFPARSDSIHLAG
ncbi:MAG: hypothetical protein U1E45_02660 [Geminicoccaceae bacterium]